MTTTTVLIPGDALDVEAMDLDSTKLALGPGLHRQDEGSIQAYKTGILKHEGKLVWIDNRQKRYVANKGDSVIGIITSKKGDSFIMDIGASDPASISFLSFEGATKKNRPDVKVGDIIYGKLIVANKHMEPELVCIDSHGKANGMGVIRDGGNLINLNLQWTRRLLSKECQLLKLLGEQLPYEVAIGLNGRIWIKGRSIKETLVIGDILKNGEIIPEKLMKSYVSRTLGKILGKKM